VILRPGGITAEALGKVLRLKPGIGRRRGLSPRAPGQLKSHYAPSIPLRLAGRQELRDLARTADARTAFILLSRLPGLAAGPRVRCLSKTGNLEEAARGLYRALHDLDRPGIRIIYAERPVGRGLGAAILDRLTRASGKG
jgi:L-threonylcarbamoyladenylate synthase